MKGLISIYLDVLRFLAAVGVFVYHAGISPVSIGIIPDLYFNHKLVIIFFVISGYVIAASTARPDRTLTNYCADRLARLSSVAIPALALTYCLDAIGAWASPEIYSGINPQWQGLRLLANLFYCQQIWFFCVNPSSNNPFWSLGYEFWYYVLFGVWVFVRSARTKSALLLGICLFLGPKILLLLPAWAVGAWAFQSGKRWSFSSRSNWLLFLLTGLTMVLALLFEYQLGLNNGKVGKPPLYYSSSFVGDTIFALVVAANFFFCSQLSKHQTGNLESYRIVKFIRWVASHTFSLYLYHVPILWFLLAIGKYDPKNPWSVFIALTSNILLVAILSKVTEERYSALRALSRRWMGALANRWKPETEVGSR